jgi:hypothetical protein
MPPSNEDEACVPSWWMTSLVGDVASVAASVHAALGGVSAGCSARSTGRRALLNGRSGGGGGGVA